MLSERRTPGGVTSTPGVRRRNRSAGPDELLEAIVASHGDALTSFVRRLTGDPHQAEDIVQETLLRAWKHPEALDGTKGSPRAWLFTVARRVAVDHWRRNDRGRIDGGRRDADRSDHLPESLDRMVDGWMLSAAVDGLSPEHRDVLHHTVWLEHSVTETADALGIPSGTVKSRTYYALRALRLSLEEIGFFS